MKHLLAPILISFTATLLSFAEEQNPFEESARKGLVSMEKIQKMTVEDIPEKWKTTKTILTKKDTKVVEFRRGKKLILTVTSYGEHRQTSKFKQRYVNATIYHKNKKIASVYRLKDDIHFKKEIEDSEYKITTILGDDGKKQLIALGPDDYVEAIIFDERDSKPISDLEYAKSKLSQEFIVKPMMKDLEDKLIKKLEDKKAKAKKNG